jgi:photosystem II stability/assembly factor-like uncharacterized protein
MLLKDRCKDSDNSARHQLGWARNFVAALAFVSLAAGAAYAQQVNPDLYSGMRWRLIGPFRAGRASAVTGVPSQPGVYYFGAAQGGVWKTNDGGQVWRPIFDREGVASIGAVTVAASNPHIVYVGTGESTPGNGVYKSTDAGATWSNIGLGETRYIAGILVDPKNPDIVLVAAAGDRVPGPARGVFKSIDGGKTWNRVLFKDETTGAMDICFAPDDARVVYVALGRRALGTAGGGNAAVPDAGIYLSTDEGSTWNAAGGQGLPPGNLGRIGISVAPGTQGRRIYAILSQGLFRSDDAGATWRRSTTDPRLPTFNKVLVDPRNANVIYVPQTSLYRSTDGGQTFEPFMGAPSGDDARLIWVNPEDSRHIILGVDQGAIISMNGGETWSNWYNQPTGQFYHVSTDNDFPYRVYAAQQDSGTAAVLSRSDYGEITYRDWAPVGGFEFGFIVADPRDPNIVYSGGWYNTVIRFDRRTGQYAHVFVPSSKYRSAQMSPLVFSPQDPHTLYLGTQFVLKTTDGGMSWQAISPDLAPAPPQGQATGGRGRGGAISSLAPSTRQAGMIWAGTTTGLVHLTRDAGAAWQDVSAGLPSPASITLLEASRHDPATAYVALNAGLDGKPYIFRTRDYGRTWQKIVEGLAETAIVRVVREDPVRKGLLYAGTETGVYVSFDDGERWQSLQLNLPTTSVRDLEVHGDDLVAATYGRALWILDDVTPLRQADARLADAEAHLFRPQTGLRWRWDQNQDTPLPPETPAGQNPPDGAIVDYYLKSAPAGEITLEVLDARGNVVRRYSSEPPPASTALPNAPSYWFAPPEVLPKTPGMHRFAWDLRYPYPLALPYSYFGNLIDYIEYTLADHAVPGQTPRNQPVGPLAVPGEYKVVLNVGGKSYSQPLTLKLDPRLRVSTSDLAQQLDLEMRIGAGMAASFAAFHQVRDTRAILSDRKQRLAENPQAAEAIAALGAFDQKLALVADGTRAEPGIGPANRELARLATMAQSADIRPPETVREAVAESCQTLNKGLAQWRELSARELPAINSLLQKNGVAPLPVPTPIPADMPCGS